MNVTASIHAWSPWLAIVLQVLFVVDAVATKTVVYQCVLRYSRGSSRVQHYTDTCELLFFRLFQLLLALLGLTNSAKSSILNESNENYEN